MAQILSSKQRYSEMGIPKLPFIPHISLLLLPLILIYAQEDKSFTKNCQNSFHCGTNGLNIEFPLYNIETHPGCGLIPVTCRGKTPIIYLGRSPSSTNLEFVVERFLTNQSAKVFTSKLQDLILANSCETFTYFDPLYYSRTDISHSIYPSIALFRCDTSTVSLKISTQQFFNGSYYSYVDCPGSTIYYPYPNYKFQNSSSFPDTCKPIRLPIIEAKYTMYTGDLFSFLGNEFSLGWNVSDECWDCHLDGGQCSGSNQNFYCAKEKKREGKSKLRLTFILVSAIPGTAILLFCLLILVLRFSKYLKFKSKNDREVEAFLKNHGSLSSKRYTHSQVKKMTKSFETKLGQGGYGSVFKGKLKNGQDVAVKVLKEVKGNGEEFVNEVATISRTSHVNIVSLLGFCYEGHKRALIYEYMPNGSLEKFICDKNSNKNKLDWDVLYDIVIGVARGLEYLHRGCNTSILHLDIKPHNILLDDDFCPKISDFGLAMLCLQKESIISLLDARGTIGYIAPEVFCRNFGGVSRKSDVYSYGMMVLEMVGERETRSIEAEVGHTSEIYFPNWIYKRLERNIELGLTGVINEDANQNLRKMIIVGLWCIQTAPTRRPSMSKVVEMLEGSLEALEIPPKPYFQSSPSRSIVHFSTTPSISSNYSK